MSEYQYYEFAAVDQPLSAQQQAELRAVSTRATITSAGFVNTYEWGDLRADPRALVERYFDAFLYLSNWGTNRLMLRMPAALLDERTAADYCVGDAATVWTAGEHTVLDLIAEDLDGSVEQDWSEGGGEGRLASMVPARTELAAGDRRLLYLAWLLCVQAGEVADEEFEPPVPAGLDRLTPDLRSVAAFLRVDADLLAAAADAGPDIQGVADRVSRLRQDMGAIPQAEKDAMLLRVAEGDGQRVRAELLAHAESPAATSNGSSRRTAAELVAMAQTSREQREREEHRTAGSRRGRPCTSGRRKP